MKYTLDRFEENFALLETEDKTMLQVPKADLPPDAKEGSILTCTDGKWSLSAAETQETAARIQSKMAQLWQ